MTAGHTPLPGGHQQKGWKPPPEVSQATLLLLYKRQLAHSHGQSLGLLSYIYFLKDYRQHLYEGSRGKHWASPLHGPAGTQVGRAGQYLRGGGDRRALGLRDQREEQRSPEEGLESARSLAEGRIQARACQQPRDPLPSPLPGPPGAHKNPLPLRLWLSWDALSWGRLATSGRAVTKGEGATGADGRLHTLGGTGAHGLGCPDARDKVEEALYTLDPESQGSPGMGRPSRPCAQSLPQALPGGPPLPC